MTARVTLPAAIRVALAKGRGWSHGWSKASPRLVQGGSSGSDAGLIRIYPSHTRRRADRRAGVRDVRLAKGLWRVLRLVQVVLEPRGARELSKLCWSMGVVQVVLEPRGARERSKLCWSKGSNRWPKLVWHGRALSLLGLSD